MQSALPPGALDRPFGFLDRLRPADMQPDAIEPHAEQTPFFRGGEEEGREAKHIGADAGEELRLDDPDAGIDEGRDAAGIARPKPPGAIHGEIARPVDADRAG